MFTPPLGPAFDLSCVRSSCHPLDASHNTGDNDEPWTDSSRGLRCRGKILQRSSKPNIRFEASSLKFERPGPTQAAGRAVRIHRRGQRRPSTNLLPRDGLGRQKERLHFRSNPNDPCEQILDGYPSRHGPTTSGPN